jgi:hypothetical protein
MNLIFVDCCVKIDQVFNAGSRYSLLYTVDEMEWAGDRWHMILNSIFLWL